jgi:hypothetical protein
MAQGEGPEFKLWYLVQGKKKKKVNISRKIELAQCQPRSG